MDGMSTHLRTPARKSKSSFARHPPRNFSSLPLDSVAWYRVYTCSERSDRDGYPLDWTGGPPSRGRRGNSAVLRARRSAGGTATPDFWLSSVLRAGGLASPL